jgi:hypothetical protein
MASDKQTNEGKVDKAKAGKPEQSKRGKTLAELRASCGPGEKVMRVNGEYVVKKLTDKGWQ